MCACQNTFDSVATRFNFKLSVCNNITDELYDFLNEVSLQWMHYIITISLS